MTAVRQSGRFGALDLAENGNFAGFRERQVLDGPLINGGVFVLEPSVIDRIAGTATM